MQNLLPLLHENSLKHTSNSTSTRFSVDVLYILIVNNLCLGLLREKWVGGCVYGHLFMHAYTPTHVYWENPKFVSSLIFSASPAEVRGFMFVTSAYPKQTFKQATLKFGQLFFCCFFFKVKCNFGSLIAA